MQPKLLDKRTAEVNIDCIKRCPFDNELFAAGHYKQIEGENVIGGLSITRIDKTSLGKEPAFLELPPVLHLCWLDIKSAEGYVLLAACRDSHLRIMQYSPSSHSIKLLSELQLEPKTYYLYCDAQANIDGVVIVFSTNVETVWHLSLQHDFSKSVLIAAISSSKCFKMHEFSVWTCRLSPYNYNQFASGDEIGRLNLYDMRLPQERYFTNNKCHQGGVSDIVFSKSNQNFLLTATFGGTLQWIDLRKPTGATQQYKTEGVMWRIIEDVRPCNQLLVCMSSENKYEVIRQDPKPQRLYEIVGHDSLTYSADWNSDSILTSSFYDKIVCLWGRP